MMRSPGPTVVRVAMLAALLLFVLPASAAAHAELEASRPADGDTVQGTPDEIVARYSQPLDQEGSSLTLVDAAGAKLASGGVLDDFKRMAISPVPELASGVYTVKSTTKSADDGDIERTEWSFTVEAAATPTPSPTPTAAATPTPEASASAEPSTEPTAIPTATATPTSPPTPAPSADGGTSTGSGSDVLLPIVAAVAILVIGAIWFTRRGRSTPSQ